MDGGGKTLTGFAYTSAGANDVGLFGSTVASIKRLGLVNASIAGAAGSSAALVGELLSGAVLDCFATGTVTGSSDAVGGLIGHVSGDQCVVASSYFAGSVTAQAGGGLFGVDVSQSARGCFASGDVHVTASGGPLADSGIHASNYYDSSRTCGSVACNSYGTPATPTSYFYSSANAPLSGWDFERVWQSNAPTGFPTLR